MNKEEQKQLLTEIMEADEKDGLYKTNSMAQQTAVEWLIEMISPYITDEKANLFIEQAKQMEKEQMENMFFVGGQNGYLSCEGKPFETFEKYYIKTYGK